MSLKSSVSDQAIAGDFEQLTISSTSVPPTASKLVKTIATGVTKSAVRAFITVETQPIRIRYDGTAATATVGHLLAIGDYITIDGQENVSNISMIRQAVDGVVNITYFYNRP
jgi:hypothetical protein